jgi:hypothetical protein
MLIRLMGRAWVLGCVTALLAGCRGLTANSADRVAFGLREGANRLGQSRSTNDSITVRIPSRTWPNGCPGAYRVQLFPDSAKASGISVARLRGTDDTSLHAKRVTPCIHRCRSRSSSSRSAG